MKRTLARLTPLLLAACGAGDGADPGPTRTETVLEVRASLLADVGTRRVERQHPDRAVAVEAVDVGGARVAGRGPLPALVAAPPSVVHLELPPDLPPGAALSLAVGVGEGSLPADEVGVVFEVLLDGRAAGRAELRAGRDVPRHERRWVGSSLPLDGVHRVTLTTRQDGASAAPLDAAWGRLEVVAPRAVERAPVTPEQPSVVLVLIDTLRADRLSSYGYARPTSPYIDALAARGTRYARAYSSASWTWPSTASIFTGLTPPEHGLVDQGSCLLAHELSTLAEAMRDAGLHTAAFSTNPLVSESYNFHQGFDRFSEYGMVPAAEVLPDVEAWLRQHADERFFLYVHLTDPHGPYEPDPALAADLVPAAAPAGYEKGDCKELLACRLAGEPVDVAELERHVEYISALYDGEVRTVDAAVGRLEALLAELGLADRTVVALTSDHGEEFLDHGLNGHGRQLYDECVHVPLLLAGPRVEPGRVVATPVQNRFLPQTLLRLAGEGPAGFDATRDLLAPAALAALAREPVYLSTATGCWVDLRQGGFVEPVRALYGVRSGGFALDWAPRGDGPEDDLVRLFDLTRDPGMTIDFAADHPDRVRALRRSLATWLERATLRRPAGPLGGDGALATLRGLGYVGEE